MADYVVWGAEEIPRGIVLDELEGAGDFDIEMTTGQRCLESFPHDVVFTADKDFPNNLALADTIENTKGVVVVSQKLKEFLESWNPPEVEFLPVTVLNHKKRPAGKYFIVHPVSPVDVLKAKESGAKYDPDMDDWVDSVKKIVLDKSKIDPDRLLFKLHSFYECVLIRKDLADAITKKGFTGVKWIDCSQYRSL